MSGEWEQTGSFTTEVTERTEGKPGGNAEALENTGLGKRAIRKVLKTKGQKGARQLTVESRKQMQERGGDPEQRTSE